MGQGGQAEVFKCKLSGQDGRFVSKNKKVFNNFRLAEEVLTEMFSEFFIGKDLDHPHIIQYNYFINQYDPATKTHDFHIIMEYLDGGDLDNYIKTAPSGVSDIAWVR